MQFISPTQIKVLAPADANQGSVPVTMTNAAGTSNAVTATMLVVLPGLAVTSNYVRAVRHPDSAIINGIGAAETGYATSAAAAPGDTVAIYGTGFGPTSPAVESGLVFSATYPTTNDVTVTNGGISAPVAWAGLVGPGLYQIKITVPAALADGDHAVIATVSGSSSQSTANSK